MGVTATDYATRIGGGTEIVGGWSRGAYQISNAIDSTDGTPYHTFDNHGVNGDDSVWFIFDLGSDATYCNGFRQYGHSSWGSGTFANEIEIFKGNSMTGPWTSVATDTHSTWQNGGDNAFTNTGTTTEWTASQQRYLKVEVKSNHGDTGHGGRITIRFLQLKIA